MIEFVRSNMAPLMFVGLIVFMLFGYPAAFSVAAVGLLFGFIAIQLGLIEPSFLGNLVYQVFSIVSEEQGALLLSIPFFTFMGAILERSGSPKTCWIRLVSCSGRCAAGCPMR